MMMNDDDSLNDEWKPRRSTRIAKNQNTTKVELPTKRENKKRQHPSKIKGGINDEKKKKKDTNKIKKKTSIDNKIINDTTTNDDNDDLQINKTSTTTAGVITAAAASADNKEELMKTITAENNNKIEKEETNENKNDGNDDDGDDKDDEDEDDGGNYELIDSPNDEEDDDDDNDNDTDIDRGEWPENWLQLTKQTFQVNGPKTVLKESLNSSITQWSSYHNNHTEPLNVPMKLIKEYDEKDNQQIGFSLACVEDETKVIKSTQTYCPLLSVLYPKYFQSSHWSSIYKQQQKEKEEEKDEKEKEGRKKKEEEQDKKIKQLIKLEFKIIRAEKRSYWFSYNNNSNNNANEELSYIIEVCADIELSMFQHFLRRRKRIPETVEKLVETYLPPLIAKEQKSGKANDWTPFSLFNAGNVPFTSTVPQKQPTRITISLFKYQLDAVSWMKEVEDMSKVGWPLPSILIEQAVPQTPNDNPLYYDPIKKKIVLPPKLPPIITSATINNDPYSIMQQQSSSSSSSTSSSSSSSSSSSTEYPQSNVLMFTKGGMFCDEVGLGKTLTMITLTLVNGPPGSNAIAMNPARRIRPALAKCKNADGVIEHAVRLHSKATLIVCPSHLAEQWKQEAITHSNPPLKTYTLSTIHHHRSMKWEDALESDLIIITVQFLRNKNYLMKVLGVKDSLPSMSGHSAKKAFWEKRSNRIKKIACQQSELFLADPAAVLRKKEPILESIHWRRIVLDEGHEALSTYGKSARRMTVGNQLEDIGNYLSDYSANFHWYQTGTPFPRKDESLRVSMSFLGWKIRKGTRYTIGNLQELVQPAQPLVYEMIHKLLYWKNSKSEVEKQGEYHVPEIVEETIKITLSEVERGMYMEAARHSDETRLRMLCCHPQISEYDRRVLGEGSKRTMEEIRKMLVYDRKSELSRAIEREAEITKQLEDPQEDEKELTEYQRQRLVKEREGLRKRIPDLKSTLAYMESIVPAIAAVQSKQITSTTSTADNNNNNNNNDNDNDKEDMMITTTSNTTSTTISDNDGNGSNNNICPICYDEIQDVVVTTCGHLFCKECLQSYHKATFNRNCPSCRRSLGPGDICEVILASARGVEDKSELGKLTQTHGAKMAHLILYLRRVFEEDSSNRVIVFSEWDPLLRRVGDTLIENDISVAYLKGNVSQRMKALREFRGGDELEGTKVIMLSLENAASGLNLVEASHIILLEPVGRSAGEAKAIETQAIGRAHRLGQKKHLTVVRLITKNTIEEELHARNTEPIRSLSSSSSTLLRGLSRNLSSLRAPQVF